MLKKRSVGLIILSLLALVLSIFLVSAAFQADLNPLLSGSSSALGNFIESLSLPKNLSIILLGILLWMIMYTITKKLFSLNSKWISIGASLIMTVLAFIYLPENFVEAIVLQYGVVGATILTIIPFAAILYFTTSVSSSIFFSRVIWIFYIIYYFSIFAYKIVKSGNILNIDNLPYGAAILAGVLIFFWLPTIRNWVSKGELDAKEEEGMRDIRLRKLGRKLEREDTKARLEGTNGEGI